MRLPLNEAQAGEASLAHLYQKFSTFHFKFLLERKIFTKKVRMPSADGKITFRPRRALLRHRCLLLELTVLCLFFKS